MPVSLISLALIKISPEQRAASLYISLLNRRVPFERRPGVWVLAKSHPTQPIGTHTLLRTHRRHPESIEQLIRNELVNEGPLGDR